ncbi:MAG TPA: hypothetical protein VEU30_02650 [Thermoanaerobaculia bacterium]|nr:hypothetical protein [Thermoanaerobaculia bacterium]
MARLQPQLTLPNFAPREGNVLRRAALTHQFTLEMLRILDPELTEEEAKVFFTRFSRLSAVMITPDGLALHDRAREHLFSTWLRAPEGEFREIHARLAAFVAAQIEVAGDTTAFEKLSRRLTFHRVGVDQNDASPHSRKSSSATASASASPPARTCCASSASTTRSSRTSTGPALRIVRPSSPSIAARTIARSSSLPPRSTPSCGRRRGTESASPTTPDETGARPSTP